MTLVVDASVAIKWVVEEAGSPQARAYLGKDRLVAPDLISAEVANILWRHSLTGVSPPEVSDQRLEGVLSMLDTLYPSRPLAKRALQLALGLSHPAYDCFYLALAEAIDTKVLTADARFAGRLQGSAFADRVQVLA
jgi:predicted nucleic acid-binding protein